VVIGAKVSSSRISCEVEFFLLDVKFGIRQKMAVLTMIPMQMGKNHFCNFVGRNALDL